MDKRPIHTWRSRRSTSARDVRGAILETRAIARPVIKPGTIDHPGPITDRAAVVCDCSLDWTLDRVRYEWVVVGGSPISCPLGGSLHYIRHDRVVVILS